MKRQTQIAILALSVGVGMAVLSGQARAFYVQTNLVSDLPGVAEFTDPNLVNPWGISFGPATPFWVSDQGTQKATLYNGAGQPFPVNSPLVVSIPPSGTFGPTGQVFNNTTGFVLSDGSPALFIFANLNGSISAWNGGLGTAPGVTAQVVAQPVSGASFTGLALANNLLYAADKGTGTIDVYNSSFGRSGIFTDLNVPAGFTPYNIQQLSDGRLYVTFENKTNPNMGAVEILNSNGTFQTLIPSTDAHLKEPWGLALAPSTFGPFGGDLLVGNKRDGTINAFNPTTGAFVGTLTDASGNPIADPGLWGLAFRQTGSGFDPNALYFAAGVGFLGGQGNDIYAHGLFGSISFVPEPASAILLGLGMVVLCGVCHWGSRRRQRGSAPGKEGAIHVP
jgi:uncharacterized protein (TIGR03118 family)